MDPTILLTRNRAQASVYLAEIFSEIEACNPSYRNLIIQCFSEFLRVAPSDNKDGCESSFSNLKNEMSSFSGNSSNKLNYGTMTQSLQSDSAVGAIIDFYKVVYLGQ